MDTTWTLVGLRFGLVIEELIKTPLGNYSLVSWEDVIGIPVGRQRKYFGQIL
jgi:hypothetical protein